jgi:hypothetical protein
VQLVQKFEVTRGQHGNILMSSYFPSFIVCWILNFVDKSTHENNENWYPTNKSDFTVVGFTTTGEISGCQHQSCEFEPRSWRGVLDTTICDKICQ